MKEPIGWPEAIMRIVQSVVILGIFYCFASCMHGGPLL